MHGIDPYYLAYVGVFIGALFGFEGIRQALSRGEDGKAAKSRRMRMIAAGATPDEVLQLLRAPQKSGWWGRLPVISDLPRRMKQAGIVMKPEVFLLLCAAGAIVIYVVASRFIAAPGAIAAGAAGLLVPLAVVESMRRKRIQKLITQLPDALDLMSRGLRVGHPLNTTIASVANEMPDPIATEFGIVVDQISYGDDIVTALREMADRVGEEDVHYLAVSVGIQHGTGGNLARVLGVLAKVIRDRAIMRRKIKAITAEGRASAWVLSALPVLVFVIVNVMTPSFYGAVRDDPMFMPAMYIIIFLVVANFLALRKLATFKL